MYGSVVSFKLLNDTTSRLDVSFYDPPQIETLSILLGSIWHLKHPTIVVTTWRPAGPVSAFNSNEGSAAGQPLVVKV